MNNFICVNCTNSFMHEVRKEFISKERFQMIACPRCDTILYWSKRMNTNVAKPFSFYSETIKSLIISNLKDEGMHVIYFDNGTIYE